MIIASYNLRNLFDAGVAVGAAGGEVVLTQTFVDACAADVRRVADFVSPDILLAQEIGSERVFRSIAEMYEPKYGIFLATPDARGIANGAMYRGAAEARALSDVANGFPVFVEGDEDSIGRHLSPYRALVYLKTRYKDKPLHIIGVHLKTSWPMPLKNKQGEKLPAKNQSEAGDGVIRATMLKLAQAKALRVFIDELFRAETDAQIIVTGDFNATEHAEALRIIAGELYAQPETQLENLCERVPDAQRYSYMGQGKKRCLDHMLVSRSLIPNVREIRILNETLVDQSGKPNDTFIESDHAPVVLSLA
jgi:endonuclease/exonuclease/phosphatase family metal-dependent hydrolase